MSAHGPTTVYLADVQRLLSLFAQGLSGRYLQLRPLEALKGDWQARGPTTDGAAIYLPESVDCFATSRENLAFYRIAVLHQVGFFEFGTYAFSIDAARARLPALPPESDAFLPTASPLERFFGLWPSPALMRQLFMTLEDLRIDRSIRARYPGARHDLDRVLAQALAQRPEISRLRAPQVLLEALVRRSLGETPCQIRAQAQALLGPHGVLLEAMLHAADGVDRPDADVVDSAGAAIACFDALCRLGTTTTLPLPGAAPPPDAPAGAGPAPPAPSESDTTADGAFDPDDIDAFPVPFRGEVQPELVQRQLRARGIVGQLDAMVDGEGDTADTPPRAALERTLRADQSALRRAFGRLDDGARSFLYDEWDFNRQTWLKGWCRLYERKLKGEDGAFIHKVRERHGEVAQRVRRQFRQLKPASYDRVRRVSDGEELELDGIIEAVIDRRAGHATDERVYVRRQKAQRDVAAAFLLDMSASTDFQVPDPEAPSPSPEVRSDAPEAADDMPFLWNYDVPAQVDAPETPKRRVIDIARESLALMSEALGILGDRHAVYGFSGYGREEVDFFIAKDFQDRVSAKSWAALSAMEPKRSTRMGPAIRHALNRLARQEARLKVLIIVSDGFPEDCDYGPDRDDHEYGIQDTAMALREAAQAGVEAFCLTVDRAGNDYLRKMIAADRHRVIDEVGDLPEALSGVYRSLTA